MLANWPQGRRILASAGLCLCIAVLIVTAFQGMADSFLVRAAQTVAIAVAAIGFIGMVMAIVTGRLADYTEPADAKRPKERAGRLFSADGGAIALQAHDAGSVWYFKDIRVKRLP